MRRRLFQKLCCYSVAKLYLTLCDPMNCSTLDFPVLHHLPEFAQTHVYWIGDAIQPSHPLSPPFLALIFPSIRVLSSESALPIRWPKYWSFSFSISPLKEERQRTGRFLFSSFFLIEVIPFPQSSVIKGQLVVTVIAALICVLSMFQILY